MPKWYKYILIICDIALLGLILLYSYVNINKYLFDGFTDAIFILLFDLFIYGILFLIVAMIVVAIFLKFKNLFVIFFSLIVGTSSILFYFYGYNITNSIFCDKAIREKLNEKFGDNYKIVAKNKIGDNYVYDVYLNDNNKVVFNNKIDMDDSCMWSINCKYVLYSNYSDVYFKYYLERFNNNMNNNLIINIRKYSDELKQFNSMMNLEMICNDKLDCNNSYNSLLEFKKYLLNNKFNIENIYIAFYSSDNKQFFNKKFLELQEHYVILN